MSIRFVGLSLAVVLSAVAGAQVITDPFYGPAPLERVKDFLQLTDDQLQTILANNDAYNRFSADKQSRIRQVQTEIVDETAKESLDPDALGIRYAEIELICRQLKAQAADYQNQNVGVLTDAQKAKLKVLVDAMNLIPTITEAQTGNLLGAITTAPSSFVSNAGTFSFGSTGVGGVYGCQPAGGSFSAFLGPAGFPANPMVRSAGK